MGDSIESTTATRPLVAWAVNQVHDHAGVQVEDHVDPTLYTELNCVGVTVSDDTMWYAYHGYVVQAEWLCGEAMVISKWVRGFVEEVQICEWREPR